MQDKEKIEIIRCLLQDLTANNEDFKNGEKGIYYDYDGVIEHLKKAQEIIDNSVHIPRPKDLPEDLPWRETFADPDENFDPYVYDGSMSPEDYKKWYLTLKKTETKGLSIMMVNLLIKLHQKILK